ncbi:hypothetical protein ACI2KR_31390 [Pseudomonas luteola]
MFNWNEDEIAENADKDDDFPLAPQACPLDPDGTEQCESCQ